jgi:hypothetical protein
MFESGGLRRFEVKHKGPPGGASGPFAFKSRLLSRDATGGGSSRPEALDNYDINLRSGSCGSGNFGTVFGLKLWKAKIWETLIAWASILWWLDHRQSINCCTERV